MWPAGPWSRGRPAAFCFCQTEVSQLFDHLIPFELVRLKFCYFCSCNSYAAAANQNPPCATVDLLIPVLILINLAGSTVGASNTLKGISHSCPDQIMSLIHINALIWNLQLSWVCSRTRTRLQRPAWLTCGPVGNRNKESQEMRAAAAHGGILGKWY